MTEIRIRSSALARSLVLTKIEGSENLWEAQMVGRVSRRFQATSLPEAVDVGMQQAAAMGKDPNRPKSQRKGPTAKFQEEIAQLRAELAKHQPKEARAAKAPPI